MFSFGFKIRSMGFFRGFIIPDSLRLFVDGNAGSPFALKQNNANESRLVAPVWLANILRIARFVNYSKVGKPVVGLVAVDMVNQPFGPLAGHVQPNQSMCLVNFAFYADGAISKFVDVSGNIANMNTLGCSFNPSKLSGFGVIMKNVFKFLDGKISNKHRGSPELVSYINTGVTS